MSLSSWFRDYVYIPLGGNRKHVYVNLAIVFLMTGIWHGAAYQFVFWGIFHGFFIVVERYCRTHIKGVNMQFGVIKALQHIYTLVVVMIGWVFFRAPGMMYALRYVGSMFGILPGVTPRFDVRWYLDRYSIFILIIAVLWSTLFLQKMYKRFFSGMNEICRIIITNIGLLILFIYSLSCIVMSTYNPFIYFQF